MEYKELQLLWDNYDSRLDALKKLDKQLIIKTILIQKQNRIKSLIKGDKFSLVCYILSFIIIIWSGIEKVKDMDWKLFLGIGILLFSMLDYYLLVKKRNTILKRINLKTDTIIKTINTLNQYPKTRFKNLLHLVIFFPIYLSGLTLIIWDRVIIDDPNPLSKIYFLSVIYLIGGLIGIPFYIQEKRKINHLIIELNELKDDEL